MNVQVQPVAVDGRQEWFCRSCLETDVWSRSTCRRCQTGIPRCKVDIQAVSSKSGRSWSESSSSGDGEEGVLAFQTKWAQQTELRGLREEVKKLTNAGRKPTVQFEEAQVQNSCEKRESWRCMMSRTAGTSWINERESVSSNFERSTISRTCLRNFVVERKE